MAQLNALLDNILDIFFHLPTLIVFTVICIVLLWTIYDVGIAVGDDFIRLNSNRGNINLYWSNGCCVLDL